MSAPVWIGAGRFPSARPPPKRFASQPPVFATQASQPGQSPVPGRHDMGRRRAFVRSIKRASRRGVPFTRLFGMGLALAATSAWAQTPPAGSPTKSNDGKDDVSLPGVDVRGQRDVVLAVVRFGGRSGGRCLGPRGGGGERQTHAEQAREGDPAPTRALDAPDECSTPTHVVPPGNRGLTGLASLGRETGGWLANRFGGVLALGNRP